MSAVKYRPDIDGLRCIAVGSVVLFHAFPNLLKGGFVGVDIFFVISGYLISSIIFRSLEEERFSYLEFYVRRVKRIFPALALVFLAALAFGWYVLLPDEFQALGKHVAAGAGFVSNFVLWNETGYFDAAAESKPLLHLWSLGIEEQFYILWPLALGLLWKRRSGFLTATLLVAAISFSINVATVQSNPISAFYSPLSRFWELMVGGTLAYIVLHRGELLSHHANLRAVAGVALIGCGIAALTVEKAFPGYWALLPAIGTFLVISAGADAWINKYILGNRLMVAIGLISYPLYLWHWPILVFSKIALGRLPTPADRLFAVAAAFVLAALTYRLLERPVAGSSSRWTPGILVIVMMGIGAAGILVFAGAIPSRLQTRNITQILEASYDWKYPPVGSRNFSFGALRYFVEDSDLSSHTLFVGDSNMEQYAPRIDRVIKENRATSNGAIFVGNQTQCPIIGELIAAEGKCSDAMTKLQELMDQSSTRAVVIVAAWASYTKALTQPENRTQLTQMLRSISAQKKVYIVLNMPAGEELSPRNMFTGSRLSTLEPKPTSSIRFDLEGFEKGLASVNGMLAEIARDSGATLIEPVATLCPQRQCPVFDSAGTPLYLDQSHLTQSYAASAATYMDITLKP